MFTQHRVAGNLTTHLSPLCLRSTWYGPLNAVDGGYTSLATHAAITQAPSTSEQTAMTSAGLQLKLDRIYADINAVSLWASNSWVPAATGLSIWLSASAVHSTGVLCAQGVTVTTNVSNARQSENVTCASAISNARFVGAWGHGGTTYASMRMQEHMHNPSKACSVGAWLHGSACASCALPGTCVRAMPCILPSTPLSMHVLLHMLGICA